MAVTAMFAQGRARLPEVLDRIVGAVEVAVGAEQRSTRAVGMVDHPLQQGNQRPRPPADVREDAGEGVGGAEATGPQDGRGRGVAPGIGDGPPHHRRMEVEEHRRHRARTDRSERGGAGTEVAHPEPAHADGVEVLAALGCEVRHRVHRFEAAPQRPASRRSEPPARSDWSGTMAPLYRRARAALRRALSTGAESRCRRETATAAPRASRIVERPLAGRSGVLSVPTRAGGTRSG